MTPQVSTPIAPYGQLSQALNGPTPGDLLGGYGGSILDNATRPATGQAAQAPDVAKYNAMQAAPRPAPPNLLEQLQSMPEYQEMQQSMKEAKGSAQGWLQSASILGGLVGLGHKGHVTAALKAFAGAAKGYQQADTENRQELLDKWKEANDTMLEKVKDLQDDYTNALNDRKASLDEQMQKIMTIASENHDTKMMELAANKDMTSISMQVQKLQIEQEKAKSYADGTKEALDKTHLAVEEQKSALDTYKSLHGLGATDKVNPQDYLAWLKDPSGWPSYKAVFGAGLNQAPSPPPAATTQQANGEDLSGISEVK